MPLWPELARHMEGTNCVANVCSCPHGTAKTGAACTAHGTEMCSACSGEYHLSGGVCVANTQCGSQQHQTVAPTGTSNRECADNTQCGAGQYQSVVPTTTSDRDCASHTPLFAILGWQ